MTETVRLFFSSQLTISADSSGPYFSLYSSLVRKVLSLDSSLPGDIVRLGAGGLDMDLESFLKANASILG